MSCFKTCILYLRFASFTLKEAVACLKNCMRFAFSAEQLAEAFIKNTNTGLLLVCLRTEKRLNGFQTSVKTIAQSLEFLHPHEQ